ncbi:MAG: response regulator [Candidatus Magnetobacterium sp. LHC-1]
MKIFANVKRLSVVIITLCVVAIILYFTVEWTKAIVLYNIKKEATQYLDVYNTYLTNKVNNYLVYPKILAESNLIIDFLDNHATTEMINSYLEQFNAAIGAEFSYVINSNGTTIASSNWNTPGSLVGNNYTFRPYFKQAIQGGVGRYVAIGVTSKVPGYYVSYPVKKDNRIIGVVVVKSSLDIMKPNMKEISGKLFVADKNGVIFVSSDKSYTFNTVQKLSEETIAEIRASKQYTGAELSTLPIQDETSFRGITVVTLHSVQYVVTALHIDDNDWNVYLFSEIHGLYKKIYFNIAIELLIITITVILLLLSANIRLRRSSMEMLRRREELEIMVNARTEELQVANEMVVKAKKEAERANHAKSDFLANMSHEIRTPMNGIIGLLSLAFKTELNNKQLDYLAKINTSAHTLMGIINDILDLSKIEAGKLDMEYIPFHLDEVLHNISNLITLKTEEKGLEFCFSVARDVPLALVGDPLRLGQILLNLSNNAVKFTTKGEIIIAVESEEVTAETVQLHFSVKDSGIGLTQQQINALFQPFTQADTSTSRKYGGTGLGLTISKRLTEMMNGRIWVESEPGRGSNFQFTALFARQNPERRRFRLPSDKYVGMRVLLADDNPASRDILTDALESFSFKVTPVSSGIEALAELKRSMDTPYDMIFIDWKMPDMDGITTAQEINRLIPDKPPKVIMVTAYGREEVMHAAKDAHLDGILIKPVSLSLMFETILSVVGEDAARYMVMPPNAEVAVEGIEKLAGARILLVEDNEINQQVAVELLQSKGFIVDIANNGVEAVEAVTKTSFDVVLMDIQMPGIDGYEATRRIRQQQEFKDLPIIAMTANVLAGEREKCLAAGMNDHVGKPIQPKGLYVTLLKWLKPGEAKDALPLSIPDKKSTEADNAGLPANLKGIDIRVGLERLSGNSALYLKILREFRDKYGDSATTVYNGLENKDYESVYRLVHTLAGVAGTIGAIELHTVSRQLDKALKDSVEHIPDLTLLLRAFQKALDDVITELYRLDATTPPAVTQAPAACTVDVDIRENETVTTSLGKLAFLLEEGDSESFAQLQTLKGALTGHCKFDELIDIENQINDYDFDKALNSLIAFSRSLGISVKKRSDK